MPSLRRDIPRQYRARAEDARTQAAAAPDEATRRRWLADAEKWERMAAFEEQHPEPPLVPPYYPPPE